VIGRLASHLVGWKGYALTAAVSATVAYGAGWWSRDVFADLKDAKTEASALKADREVLVGQLRGMLKADEISADIGQKSAERQVQIRTVTRNIIKEVPVYVAAEADAACPIPVGFVRLHDAAAAGAWPAVPIASGPPNDAPSGIALSGVAATVAENYGSCRETAERLTSLQEWIRSIAATWSAPAA